MNPAREPALQALFALVSGCYPWASTPSRRLKLWTDVPRALRPALFQHEGGRDTYTWTSLPGAARKLEAKLFVYIDGHDKQSTPASQVNAVLDAIDTAMQPAGPDISAGRNTLGGTCYSARIMDVPLKDPGDLDGDGLVIVHVEIALP